jgi:hypothetical protein
MKNPVIVDAIRTAIKSKRAEFSEDKKIPDFSGI